LDGGADFPFAKNAGPPREDEKDKSGSQETRKRNDEMLRQFRSFLDSWFPELIQFRFPHSRFLINFPYRGTGDRFVYPFPRNGTRSLGQLPAFDAPLAVGPSREDEKDKSGSQETRKSINGMPTHLAPSWIHGFLINFPRGTGDRFVYPFPRDGTRSFG
jgi:hypothetical protein